VKIDDRTPAALGAGEIRQPTGARNPGAAAGRPAESGPSATPPAATVELSVRALELHSALRAVRAAADVRPGVVADVQSRLKDGRYKVNAEATARGILDRRA
jgi:flagellar biosynthesis anti-sigma factor FlgM